MAKAESSPRFITCQRCQQPCERIGRHQKRCPPCRKITARERAKLWVQNNVERAAIRRQKWYEKNLQNLAEYKQKYRAENRPLIRSQQRRWEKQNPEKLKAIRSRQYQALMKTTEGKINYRVACAVRRGLTCGSKRGRSTFDLLGYTVGDLARHLERQFSRGMTWENYGPVWHIDHIVPLASFDFDSPDDPGFKACWAITNLRPLWKADNMKKNAKREFLL